MPLRVDVIIAVHDSARPIARAVGSVLRGAGDDIAVSVVCHDISAGMIAASLGDLSADRRVRLVEHRDGVRSPSGPFNAGLDACTAEWVSIMGSDDELELGAVDEWVRVAQRSDAQVVLPRIVRRARDGSRTTVATPPSRPGRRRGLDGVRDRLAYRSAPLGLIHRGILDDLRFGGGLPQGEDVLFSSRIWFSEARVALSAGPAYVVHDDATDRVTMTPRPIASALAFIEEVLDDEWTLRMPPDQRVALAVKMLRVNVLGEFVNRPDAGAWSDGERIALARKVEKITVFAPSVLARLSIADRRVLAALPSLRDVSTDELLTLAAARRRFGMPRTVLTASPLHLLDREAPARFMVASLLARRR